MAVRPLRTSKSSSATGSRSKKKGARKTTGSGSKAGRRAKKPSRGSSTTTAAKGARARKSRPYVVRNSPIHGRGVFATRTIRKGTAIVEYRGRRISMEAADELPDSDPKNPFHTFLFELNDGRVIDAGRGGNAARWINHSCQPNCEPFEDDHCRVYITARRMIRPGEELAYDYKLNVPGRRSARLLANYACRCGSPRCRGTMIDLRKR
jgi:SET domain-containing protein